MINTPFSPIDCVAGDRENESLQEYVRALLARQQALDLLETIQQQINQVWGVMRKLLDGPGVAGKAAQAIRIARAVLAAQAQNSYRLLEQRREDCIRSLHQAERRANSALHGMLGARPTTANRNSSDFPTSARARQNDPLVCRPSRRKFKHAHAERC